MLSNQSKGWVHINRVWLKEPLNVWHTCISKSQEER